MNRLVKKLFKPVRRSVPKPYRPLIDIIGVIATNITPQLHIKTQPEKEVRNRLAASIPGSQIEVQTPYGRIDILTPKEIIEVKCATHWKSAIGQVIAYGQAYPNHRLRIHLFGVINQQTKLSVKATCRGQEIRCTFETKH